MGWTCYIAFKTSQEAEALAALKIEADSQWLRRFEDMTVIWRATHGKKMLDALRGQCIPYFTKSFQGEDLESAIGGERYYDHEGVLKVIYPVRNEDEMTLWYHKISATPPTLPNHVVYRMAQVLSGHSNWGDVKHNTAMARLRQALTQ